MKLTVKNKLVSLRNNSFVLDEKENTVFKVKGKFFTFTDKKKIYDMNGNLLYIVRNKFWHFFATSTFIYDANKNLLGKFSNNDWDLKHKFIMQVNGDDYIIQGKLFQFPNFEMTVTKNDKVIGTITKNFTIVRDVYTIDVDDNEDAGFMVAIAISIDNIFDDRRKKANKN